MKVEKTIPARRAGFRQMKDASREDWEIVAAYDELLTDGLAARVLDHLRVLKQVPMTARMKP